MNDIIFDIQTEFIKEAINSPVLLSDLANMEKYISESYSGRSLIELLQNSDDAGASRFKVMKISNDVFIAANNGRAFNDNDFKSLCRSGSSTKQRKANTIGFRGIGFKSVVNYAKQVHVISGNYKITFSKELTQKVLNSNINVPLIRIPHQFKSKEYDNIIQQFINDGYRTIFIFETHNNMIEKEINEFDPSCMLFLNTISEIAFEFDAQFSILSQRIKRDEYSYFVDIKSAKECKKWLVFNDNDASIAFRYNKCCVSCEDQESVVHSFMPTKDKFSGLFKVNGDFSTDPSRTHIVIDNETNEAVLKVANLITNMFVNIYESHKDDLQIVNILKNLKVNPLLNICGESINDILVKHVKQNITNYFAQNNQIFLQPIYMNNEEFDLILKELKIKGVENIKEIPALNDFLNNLGFNYLSMEQYIPAIQKVKCSLDTRKNMLCEIIRQTRFKFDDNIKKDIENCYLFEFESGTKTLNEISSIDLIKGDFEESIINELDSVVDYNNFLKKFNVDERILAKDKTLSSYTIEQLDIQSFSKTNVVKKWRSVESNVAGVLETIKGIKQVIDVSEQNVGYDLDVLKDNGEHEYCEVKSVSGLGDSFSLTNNEYTTAIAHGKKYILAITQQTNDKILICIVKDPLRNLDFIKKATKWEFVCDTYTGKLLEYDVV